MLESISWDLVEQELGKSMEDAEVQDLVESIQILEQSALDRASRDGIELANVAAYVLLQTHSLLSAYRRALELSASGAVRAHVPEDSMESIVQVVEWLEDLGLSLEAVIEEGATVMSLLRQGNQGALIDSILEYRGEMFEILTDMAELEQEEQN